MARSPSPLLPACVCVCVLAAALVATLAAAHPSYQGQIPNGENVRRSGTPWPGVGHLAAGGGGNAENSFGVAFAAAGHTWTTALCNSDTDGDGFSNGAELGDASCTWTPGGTPERLGEITHPGYADSYPSIGFPSFRLVGPTATEGVLQARVYPRAWGAVNFGRTEYFWAREYCRLAGALDDARQARAFVMADRPASDRQYLPEAEYVSMSDVTVCQTEYEAETCSFSYSDVGSPQNTTAGHTDAIYVDCASAELFPLIGPPSAFIGNPPSIAPFGGASVTQFNGAMKPRVINQSTFVTYVAENAGVPKEDVRVLMWVHRAVVDLIYVTMQLDTVAVNVGLELGATANNRSFPWVRTDVRAMPVPPADPSLWEWALESQQAGGKKGFVATRPSDYYQYGVPCGAKWTVELSKTFCATVFGASVLTWSRDPTFTLEPLPYGGARSPWLEDVVCAANSVDIRTCSYAFQPQASALCPGNVNIFVDCEPGTATPSHTVSGTQTVSASVTRTASKNEERSETATAARTMTRLRSVSVPQGSRTTTGAIFNTPSPPFWTPPKDPDTIEADPSIVVRDTTSSSLSPGTPGSRAGAAFSVAIAWTTVSSPVPRLASASAAVVSGVLFPPSTNKPMSNARALALADACLTLGSDGDGNVLEADAGEWPSDYAVIVARWPLGSGGSAAARRGAGAAVVVAVAVTACAVVVVISTSRSERRSDASGSEGTSPSSAPTEPTSAVPAVAVTVATSYLVPSALEAAVVSAVGAGVGTGTGIAGLLAATAMLSVAVSGFAVPMLGSPACVARFLHPVVVDGLRDESARVLRAHALIDSSVACLIAAVGGATQAGLVISGSCIVAALIMALSATALTAFYALVRPFAARLEVGVSTVQAGTLAVLCWLTLVAVATEGNRVPSATLAGAGAAAEALSFGAPVLLLAAAVWERLCMSSDSVQSKIQPASPANASLNRGDTAADAAAPLLHVPAQRPEPRSTAPRPEPPSQPSSPGNRVLGPRAVSRPATPADSGDGVEVRRCNNPLAQAEPSC